MPGKNIHKKQCGEKMGLPQKLAEHRKLWPGPQIAEERVVVKWLLRDVRAIGGTGQRPGLSPPLPGLVCLIWFGKHG
jgi:hypothetical protein